MNAKDTLLAILAPSAPTGFEGAVADVIQAMLTPYADSITRDTLGNLIVTKHGPGKKIMLAAHMDQIGFIVTDIDDHGFLRVAALGGIDLSVSVARPMILSSGAHGVLHCEIEREGKPLAANHLFLDVGASTKEQAMKCAQIGDWAVYAPQVSLMNDKISSPYLDDRAGCAMLVEAFMQLKNPANEVVAVFTVQEEVGLRGAATAAYAIEPDMAIAIDVTPAGDPPKATRMTTSLGKGIAIKVMDRSIVCHPTVRALMETTAKALDLPFQREVLSYGGTDAGAIHLSRGGVPSGVLSIPCRYVHSPVETIDWNDYRGGVRLLVELLQK